MGGPGDTGGVGQSAGAEADPVRVGLPAAVRACLFDLDGVLTQTAKVHAAAWKAMFDEFLQRRAASTGAAFEPFDAGADYEQYVDGKPRADGTRSFLASRGITLPEGADDDPPDAQTVHGLGNRKNELVLAVIARDGVEVYQGSVAYLAKCRAAGLSIAVVSSSSNTHQVLAVTGIAPLVDGVVDAQVAHDEQLAGKPAPDTFLAGARLMGVAATAAVVFEDALAGVEAGRAGGFAYVVGVDRVGGSGQSGHGAGLLEHGADVVVKDLGELG
jgi:beta-phosphoglucomutase family hydrolase